MDDTFQDKFCRVIKEEKKEYEFFDKDIKSALKDIISALKKELEGMDPDVSMIEPEKIEALTDRLVLLYTGQDNVYEIKRLYDNLDNHLCSESK